MRNTHLMRSDRFNGWAFIMPALVLLGVFMVYPILWSLWMSFHVGRGMQFSFGGWTNIVRLTQDPVLMRALGNTLLFLAVQVPVMLVLALLFANALNGSRLWGRSLFRTAIFLPCVTSLVAYSVVFKSMFAGDGVINKVLLGLQVVSLPIPWLADPFWAKFVVVAAITWRWTGYNMIFYLAAMQNFDRSVFEAARIDGVPAWARFCYLTVPMLKPVILFTSVISTIGTLQLFDEPNLLTEGGPSDATLTLSMYIFDLSFRFMPSFGYAATVSYLIVILVALISLLQFLLARDRAA